MIWLGIWLLLVGLFVVFMTKGQEDAAAGVGFVALIGGAVLVLVIGLCTYSVIDAHTGITEAERNLTIASDQYEKQVATITSMASQYPIEEKLLRDLNPEILLMLPEIKSDTLLVKEIELALKYKDQVYKFQYQINACKKILDFHKRRWFSPTLASPNY